jgi:hypothetical protein
VVVLFTDGKEDVRGIENPVRIDSNVDRVGGTFVYFVSMGEPRAAARCICREHRANHGAEGADGESDPERAREIRARIPPPPLLLQNRRSFDRQRRHQSKKRSRSREPSSR